MRVPWQLSSRGVICVTLMMSHQVDVPQELVFHFFDINVLPIGIYIARSSCKICRESDDASVHAVPVVCCHFTGRSALVA